jgi:hypothetical protein
MQKHYEKVMKKVDKTIFSAFAILARKNKLKEWQDKAGEVKLQRYLNSVLKQNGFSRLIKDLTIKNDFPVSLKYEYTLNNPLQLSRRQCKVKYSALVWLLKESMKAEEMMQIGSN